MTSANVPPSPLLPPSQLSAALVRARAEKNRAVAVMVTAAHCPWCGLVIAEQLVPRIRSQIGPRLDVVVFDLADTQPLDLVAATVPPTGSTLTPGQRRVRMSPAEWAQMHGYRVAPTVAMVGPDARPLFAPLVGYSSRDFYGAYLDDHVARAQRYWSQLV